MAARKQRKEPDVKDATPTAKARPATSEPLPLSKDEVLAMDRERKQRMAELMAAQEARRAERLKQIMAERNALNGHGHGITVRD
jgi:hypothetical protein